MQQITNGDSIVDIGRFFGLNETGAALLQIIAETGPLYQAELRKEFISLVGNSVERNQNRKGKRLLSKGAKGNISKECHKLAQEKNLFDVQAPDEKRKKYDLNEEKLEWIRSCTYKLEFTRLDHLIDSIPSDLPLTPVECDKEELFRKENRLYDEGKWQDAKKLLDNYNKNNLTPIQESHRQRLLGWCNYYLGKKHLRGPKHIGNEARKAFIKVLQIGKSREDIDSALNGLSLVYYYLLKEPTKAFRIKEKAIHKVNNKAQLLNTQGLLKRDEGQIIEALNTFSEAYTEARVIRDFRTSGHALNNKARTWMLLFSKLELKNELKREIITLFEKAKIEYSEYEKSTGGSAKFHLDGIEEQINDLNTRYPWN